VGARLSARTPGSVVSRNGCRHTRSRLAERSRSSSSLTIISERCESLGMTALIACTPGYSERRPLMPPNLAMQMTVDEPGAWTRSGSDEERVGRIVSVLRGAGFGRALPESRSSLAKHRS
jgi:hypothetical protein